MRVTNKNREAVYSAIRQLQWLGKTAAEAAASLGMKVQTLNWHRRQIGLEPFEMPPRGNTRPDAWTGEEDALLAELIDAGIGVEDAAKRIGRSVKAIKFRRVRFGLPRFKLPPIVRSNPVWTPDRIQQLADLRAKGVSLRRCAPKLQTTPGAIAGACDRYLSQDLQP